MRLDIVTAIAGPRVEECWQLYLSAFDELRIAAVQRHVMFRDEFDAVVADARVVKYVAFDGEGRCCGLGTVATDLTAMPLISPDYFAHRWPELYAAGRIWYVGFVAIRPDLQRGPLLGRIVGDIGATAARAGGVAVIDVSRHVTQQKRLPQAVARFLDRLAPGTRGIPLDEQTYWAYEFPAAASSAAERPVA